jgi:anti-sigma B factor antagonist
VPNAVAGEGTTVLHEYAAPPFVCLWEMGSWGTAWVRVTGELDLCTSPELCQTLGEAQRAARVVVLDLRELCFIDSSGVHVILDAAQDTRCYGGRLLIVRGPASVDRVLTLTGVGEHVLTFDLASTEPAPAPFHVAPPEVAA